MAQTTATAYPVSISTATDVCRLYCARCQATQLLHLTEGEIEQKVPPFLAEHPGRCVCD